MGDPADLGWLGQALSGVSFVAVLGLLWRVSAWHSETAGRIKALEDISKDSRGNPGCAARHQALDAAAREAPTKGSMSDAFDQIRALERATADDRQRLAVAMERIDGALSRLEDKVDALGGEDRRPLGRTKTNPGFNPKG